MSPTKKSGKKPATKAKAAKPSAQKKKAPAPTKGPKKAAVRSGGKQVATAKRVSDRTTNTRGGEASRATRRSTPAPARKTSVDEQTAEPQKKRLAAGAVRDAAAASTRDAEAAEPARDPSDLARDEKLRNELEDETARSAVDRHRERLTAVEAEEDGVSEDDDDEENAADQREQALVEQGEDDDRR
jgi:hypothetical protein